MRNLRTVKEKEADRLYQIQGHREARGRAIAALEKVIGDRVVPLSEVSGFLPVNPEWETKPTRTSFCKRDLRDAALADLFAEMHKTLSLKRELQWAEKHIRPDFHKQAACKRWMEVNPTSVYANRYRRIWKEFDGGLAPGLDC